MWTYYNRSRIRSGLSQQLDVLVVGGGITGAGVLREAARLGLKAALVEKNDFAWGTSSWSSKMVHGGLRYLRQGDIRLTLDAVRERQALLQQAPGLVQPLPFILPLFSRNPGHKAFIRLGLTTYDLLARRWQHKKLSAKNMLRQLPNLKKQNLQGGYLFQDALTDDSRLVFCVLQEALADGALPLNYAPARQLLWLGNRIQGVLIQDLVQGDELALRAKVVINACGAWARELCMQSGLRLQLRPLRGSHLVLDRPDFYPASAVTYDHPQDKRPVFAFPFQGKTILGTTDLDHNQNQKQPPWMSTAEFTYLLSGAQEIFPNARLKPQDVISSFAGIRPVVSRGKQISPSNESRKHGIWTHKGLITVSGGKLTTFRLIALDVLAAAQKYLGSLPLRSDRQIFSPLVWQPRKDYGLSREKLHYVLGHYRLDAADFLQQAHQTELHQPCPQGCPLWAELRWSAKNEAVFNLEDLLLRRTRLGILCRDGGREFLPGIKDICRQELGWDQQTWQQQKQDYLQLWQQHYSPGTNQR